MNRHLLLNPNFRLLWFAQIASTLGTELYNVAVIVTIFQGTGSVLQTTGAVTARMLPSLLFGQMAGALVDRYPRRTVLLIVNLGRALLIGMMALLPAGWVAIPWVGYSVIVVLAVAEMFYLPAQRAIVPSLVETSQLVSANSLIYTATPLTQGISRALGVLILFLGFGAVIASDLLLFLGAAALIFSIAPQKLIHPPITIGRPVSLLGNALQGLRYLGNHSLARALVSLEALEFWPHGIWTSALMLVFTQRALHAGMQEWGWQGSMFFLGQIAGSLFALSAIRWMEKIPGRLIIFNSFLMSALTFLYSTTSSLWVALAVCFVFGPPSAMRDVSQDALLQSHVEGSMLGRIYATKQMLNNLSFMIASLLFGWMADGVSIRSVYTIGAALYLCAALYAVSQRVLRQGTLVKVQQEAPLVAQV
ncbi:MAG: MFS transporter [Caldilineaceae bacterium]